MGLKKEETQVTAKHNIIKEYMESEKIRFTNSLDVEDALEFINLMHTQTQNHENDEDAEDKKDKDNEYDEDKKDKDKDKAYFSLIHLRESNNINTKKSKKNKEIHQWSFKNMDFNTLQKIMCLRDVYISINAFYKPVRKNECVRKLNAFWVDLDYYNIPMYKGKTTEEMIKILREDGMFKGLEPSFFVDSGNGMYIFWLIKDIPKHWVETWTKIENALVEKFEKYGADANAKDIARFLRLIGTVNSKTGRKTRLIKNLIENEVIRYEILEIKGIVLKPTEWDKNKSNDKDKAKNNTNNNKYLQLKNIATLNFNRMLDLVKLVEIRGGQVINYRNIILYMYALFYMYFYQDDADLKNKIVELNNKFQDILVDAELETIITSAKKDYKHYMKIEDKYNKIEDKNGISFTDFLRKNGCIIYSNIGIIKRLKITEQEMCYMQTIMTKNFRDEKKRANDRERHYIKLEEKGEISKFEKILILKKQIIELKQQKVKNKDIVIALNVNLKTLERHITNLKKEGLL